VTTLNAQVGIAEESTYGTPVTVTRFYPFTGDGLDPAFGIVEADDEIRAGAYGPRVDQQSPYPGGASGPFGLIVPTKGFGVWLKHALGGASIGTITDSNYTQTFIPGALNGKSLTYQANRPFHPSGTAQAVTFHGVKVTGFELVAEVEDFLRATFDLDAEDHDIATGLATASYLSITEGGSKFPWSLASITIGGSAVEATKFRVRVNNNMKTDRKFLRGSALKKEPVRNGRMAVDWELDVDWVDATQYNRVAASTIDSRTAAIVATFAGPVALAGATVPQLVVTLHAARFDGGLPTVTGDAPLPQNLSGVALDNGTNPLITITYRTTDSAA